MTTPDYWLRQSKDKPLFPDLEWSRPENKLHAGKLLIIGGNAHGFAAPATAFNVASSAGIGTTRVLLPNSLAKVVGKVLAEASYCPSTPSGSFGSTSLASWLEESAWADGVLLAGDLGRNSETTQLLEAFLSKYTGPVTITGDAIDQLLSAPQILLARPDTTLVLNFAQLQKLATAAQFDTAFTSNMDMIRFVTALHEFSADNQAMIVTQHADKYCVAVNGKVSTTQAEDDLSAVAATASVWWLQHLNQPFAALTSSVLQA